MLMRMDVARHIFSHTDQKKDGYADQKDLKDGYAASGYAEVHDHNNMPDDTVMRNNHHAGAGLVPARKPMWPHRQHHNASRHAGCGRAQDPPLQSIAVGVIGEADIFKIF